MIKLLILSSQEIFRQGLSTVLSKDGELEIVGYAKSVPEALAQLDQVKPNILLLDECCDEQLLSVAVNSGIACIEFSNKSDRESVLRALSTGAKAYILKETDIDLLLVAIKAVGTGASWLDPGVAHTFLQALTRNSRATGEDTGTTKDICQNLSHREVEVLSLLCDGLANDSIAKELIISRETVKTHVSHIMEKMRVRTRTEAAVRGIKIGLGGKGSEKQHAHS